MKERLTIDADGVALAAEYHRPDGPAPGVVIGPGFGGVKEQGVDRFAERFAALGLGVLVFDHRGFGESGGEPRQEIDPALQLCDYACALSWLEARPEIRRDRLGVWGTSFGGGHAVVLAATDRRVRCAVAQVPFLSGRAVQEQRVPPGLRAWLDREHEVDAARRAAGRPPAMIPLVASRLGAPCAMPGTDAWEFFQRHATAAPRWRNEVTLRSLKLVSEYEPVEHVAKVSPTPLLLVLAEDDRHSPNALAHEAFRRAREPQRMTVIPGAHFDLYGEQLEAASRAATEWFSAHLLR